MTDTTDTAVQDMPEFTEGICGDEVVILCDGQRMSISNILAQLNAGAAERQRAAELQRLVHVEASSFANERVRADKLAAHIEALKAKLANPVVLHNERDDYQDTDEYEQGYVKGYNASRRNSVADIEKAGFTVKGE